MVSAVLEEYCARRLFLVFNGRHSYFRKSEMTVFNFDRVRLAFVHFSLKDSLSCAIEFVVCVAFKNFIQANLIRILNNQLLEG